MRVVAGLLSVDEPQSRMSDEDSRTMVNLLHRYVEIDLDQWDLWRLPTQFGEVFIDIRLSPTPGLESTVYDDLSRFLDPGR